VEAKKPPPTFLAGGRWGQGRAYLLRGPDIPREENRGRKPHQDLEQQMILFMQPPQMASKQKTNKKERRISRHSVHIGSTYFRAATSSKGFV